MTRINKKNTRAYIGGVDVSGYASDVGSLVYEYDFSLDSALSDGVKNGIAGRASINAGAINSFLDNDTAGMLNLMKTATGTYNAMIVFGSNTPVAGDPMFAWTFEQTSYKTGSGDGFQPATINLGGASFASTISYRLPWGNLLHPKGAETAVNTAVGIDDYGAQTTTGGIFCYQLFSSNGTVTLSAQDAATNSNGSFAALSGATSGSITAASTPQSGMVALATNATVRRYLRWQIVFGTATTATFAASFIRSPF